MNKTEISTLGLTNEEFDALRLILNAHAYRLLGIEWKKKVSWHVDFYRNVLVFNWE